MSALRVILIVAAVVFLLKYLIFPLIFVLANFVWKLLGVIVFVGLLVAGIKILDSVFR